MKELLRGRKTLEVLFIVSLSFVLLYHPFMRPFVKIAKYNLFRVSCAFPQELNELLQFLDENTSRKGRILIEDSEFAEQSREHAYYGGHYPALFPDHVRREYLCGPRPLYPIKHSYASFTNGLLFEKNISSITSEEMKHLFTLYNVKWIVCWMQKSKDVFNRYPEFLKKLKDIDKFTVYEVLREPTFFIKGQGRVAADYNRIALRDVVADDDDEIIISYHWMQKLKTEPPIALEKAVVRDDPVGFIKLINPPSQVVIYNAY
jgi:hypothetical protein